MTFDVDVVLRDRDHAVTERIHQTGEPREWTDTDVAAVLREILLAIDRARNPAATDRYVALRGFSWIVEPTAAGVVIAIEIPSGAAVAGPFDIEQPALDRMISRVLAAGSPRTVVH
ncbi:MAG: hypothetical protein H0W18_08560 [Acidobacteria bacterium]|nr:hypothetical protein [Acidobacteriota bacterium]